MADIYVKPMVWAGKTRFYVGYEPSNPTTSYCYRLGSYFICCLELSSAMAIARGAARRSGGKVIECESFVGL